MARDCPALSGEHGSARQRERRDAIVMRSGSIDMVEYATAGRMALPHAPARLTTPMART
jgi:hypothetical protein